MTDNETALLEALAQVLARRAQLDDDTAWLALLSEHHYEKLAALLDAYRNSEAAEAE